MLATRRAPRQPSCRCPFRSPPWDDGHPDFLRLDADLPADHHARWLAQVVARLDLQPLRRGYANRGSQAYPVELLLAFVLFLYSLGILSPAQWAQQARYDQRCQWLLRGLRPSRSRLYAFRDRLGPFLDDWHQQLLAGALAEGITSARRGSLDGTFVAALASRHQLMGPRRVDRRLLLLHLLVELEGPQGSGDLTVRLQELPQLVLTAGLLWRALLDGGLPAESLLRSWLGLLALLALLCPQEGAALPLRLPAWVPASPAGRRRLLRRYQDAQRRLADQRRPYQQKKKLSKKDQAALQRLKVSLSDPEAALGRDKQGTYRPLYNLPLVQATDAPLTLAFDVVSRCSDQGLLRPLLEQTHRQLGHPLEEVLVDDGFVNLADLQWCEQAQVQVYAPAVKEAVEAPAGGKLPKGAFVYDALAQVYRCPQGQELVPVSRTKEKRADGQEWPLVVYRCRGEHCQACPQQKSCTDNPSKGRVVKRYAGEELLERLRARMAEPCSQEVYRQRSQTVERGYADLKEHRGLRVFRCFGQARARTQAGLVILACNGLNLQRARQRRQDSGLAPPDAEKQPA
jgi:transposase